MQPEDPALYRAILSFWRLFSSKFAPLSPPPLSQRMLVKAPSKRMSADEACAHPWITKHRARQSSSKAPKGGVEPVAQAQCMTDRQAGDDGGGGAQADEQSASLDPELVRRLRNFAVGVFGERANVKGEGCFFLLVVGGGVGVPKRFVSNVPQGMGVLASYSGCRSSR